MSPSVSVVIPLYNKGLHIERTIHSVLSQTYQDFEVLVIDDGSEDEGPEIVQHFNDPRIRLIRQENRGVSAARNRGIVESNTDFIAFLDADDEWLPEFLETIMKLRDRYPDAGIYVTDRVNFEPDGGISRCRYQGIPQAPWEGLIPSYFLTAGLSDQPVCSSVAGIPKRVLMESGGFPAGIRIGEDLITWFNIALKYPVAFNSITGAIYHKEAENRTAEQATSENWRTVILQRSMDALSNGDVPEDKLDDVREFIAAYQIQIARQHLFSGEKKETRRILSECRTKILKKQKFILFTRSLLPGPYPQRGDHDMNTA
ncbi:glycosyltransferase family 2 protein [Methanofollis fontis]|uniref:Glycosyltransferase family 2 protein n=1 Tax=Methanofollis fontis TaxID=2052832 RepID=A0A483CM25_9EURY|nr:glycosyltransferase family 2 protein [Methanofollis fontis]TAJ43576.1 glycosyltransferase family 2 protein [Methanofollis fontis]